MGTTPHEDTRLTKSLLLVPGDRIIEVNGHLIDEPWGRIYEDYRCGVRNNH